MFFGKKNVAVLLIFVPVLALLSPASTSGQNSEELALLSEMNRVRAAHGAPPLRVDRRLERAARAHSSDMLRRGYFSHGAFARRLVGFGARGPAVGENLAWGVGSGSSAQAIVNAWLASPRHRANLLRRGFRRVGLGRLVGTFAGNGGAAVITADFEGR